MFATLLIALFASSASAEIIRFVDLDHGRVLRGGQPETAADYERLRGMGVRTIVNLRQDDDAVDEEIRAAARVGIQVIPVPFNAAWPSGQKIEEAYAAVTDARNQPVFFHCRHGKDRTGTIAALYRTRIQDWPVDEAYGEMKRVGYDPRLFLLKVYVYNHSEDVPASGPRFLTSDSASIRR
jgi:protein tyrosine/serine phosphatase